jgi:hypothetical protein
MQLINNNMYLPDEWRCPRCGVQGTSVPCIIVTIPDYEGKYCQTCFAKWLAANFPKLELVEKHQDWPIELEVEK